MQFGFGGLLAALAAWRYHIVNRAIETAKIKADPGMVITISIIVATTAIAIILYMFFSSTQA